MTRQQIQERALESAGGIQDGKEKMGATFLANVRADKGLFGLIVLCVLALSAFGGVKGRPALNLSQQPDKAQREQDEKGRPDASDRGERDERGETELSPRDLIVVTVFPQETFKRSSGIPVTERRTFSVPPTVHKPFRLRIVNGEASGAHRVSSAQIRINGEEVDGRVNQLTGTVKLEDVSMRSQNRIEIRLGGRPGDFLALSITGQSKTVGPLGGVFQITDPTSPVFGVSLDIPAGALTDDATVTLSPFQQTDLEQQIGQKIPADMRFFGGLTLDVGGMMFQKPISISLPNDLGAKSGDQLLVGRLDPTRPPPANFVFQGFAQFGSLDLSTSMSGSIGVLSPSNPLVSARGTIVDLLGHPVRDATVVTAKPTLLSAVTDAAGRFTIPVGLPNTYGLLGCPVS